MSEEESTLRANEEADYAEKLADEAAERTASVLAGSHLWRAPCSVCGEMTLTVPEKAQGGTARCGGCIRQAAGASASTVATGDYTVPVGYPVVRVDDRHVCGFSVAECDRRWAKRKGGRPEAFPAPVVDARERGVSIAVPRSMMELCEKAAEAGWSWTRRYSQGYEPHATTGRPGALKDVLVVRFGGHMMTDNMAWAAYMRNAAGGTWTWSSVWMWGPALTPYGKAGMTDLLAWLDAFGEMPASWYEEITARRAAAAAKNKARTVKKVAKEGAA